MQMLTKKQAAAKLGISMRSIDRLIATDDTLPCARIAGRTMFKESALEAWVDAKTRGAESHTDAQKP